MGKSEQWNIYKGRGSMTLYTGKGNKEKKGRKEVDKGKGSSKQRKRGRQQREKGTGK